MRLIDADALIKDIDGDLLDGIAEARAIEKIDNATTIGGWISVKEKLPEESGYVLTYNGHCEVLSFSKRWQKFNAYDALNDADNAIDVTHWQRLPEPPKEES